MTDRLSQESFDALPKSTQEFLRKQGLAPDGTAPGATQAAPVIAAHAPPATGLPDLDGIPDQSRSGPEFIPFDREFDFECTLDQLQHRFSERSGPNFYATITITKASPSAVAAGIFEGAVRAWAWYYNDRAFGKEKDKSDASLRRFKDFIRQASGLPEGSPGVNAKSAELLERSKVVPSLGLRLRAISVRGSERRDHPGTFFHNQTVMPLG
jgi:hypothetical protein